jgi:hypothetical protein
MKTTIWKPFLSTRRFQLAGLALSLFVSACPARAQFTQTGVTNSYNFFTTNGTTYQSDGKDPSQLLSGNPLAYPMQFFLPDSGTVPPTAQVNLIATAVNGSATFTLGTDPTGAGTTITLNNPNSAPDEVRLDWTTTYVYNGPGTSLPSITAMISATLGPSGSYYCLGGAETIWDSEAGSPFTAQFRNNFTNSFPTYLQFLQTGLGSGPWYGYYSLGSGNYSGTVIANFMHGSLGSLVTGGPTFQNNDTLFVQGYLDLVVDPGNVRVQLGPVISSALGIGTYSNAPVVFFPSNPGTNFSLQMSTNLLSTNWVAVTNGVPFTAVQVTNAPSPAVFRLH